MHFPPYTHMEHMIPRPDFVCFGEVLNKTVIHETIISIKQLNMDKVEAIALDRSDPSSPNYSKWLSHKEIGDLTKNSESVEIVKHWLKTLNIKVSWESTHQHYIRARAPVSIWESLLNTTFSSWKKQDDADSVPICRASSYYLPTEMTDHISDIFNTVQLPPLLLKHSHRLKNSKDKNRRSLVGGDHVTVSFLNELYKIDSNTGDSTATQSLFQTNNQSYSYVDLDKFGDEYNLKGLDSNEVVNVNGQRVAICYDRLCDEGNLDIQYIMGVAQKTTTYFWHISSGDPFLEWIIDVASSPNPPMVHSVSWGTNENSYSSNSMNRFNNEAIKLAAMGVTIVVSSGDTGVSGNSCQCNRRTSTPGWWGGSNSWSGVGYIPSFPASCPWVTAVGATMGPEHNDAEVACQADQGGVITSGGGFSTYFSQPSWQTEAVDNYFDSLSSEPRSGYNRKGRGFPDVSFIGVNYPVYINGDLYSLYGTSASAPLFGAMISLLNAERFSRNETSIGFLNPTLYSSGLNTSIVTFNDITVGDNKCCLLQSSGSTTCCASGFETAAGWDPVTGWGSIAFTEFAYIFGTVATYTPPEDSRRKNSWAYIENMSNTEKLIALLVVLAGMMLVSGLYYLCQRCCRRFDDDSGPPGTASHQRRHISRIRGSNAVRSPTGRSADERLSVSRGASAPVAQEDLDFETALALSLAESVQNSHTHMLQHPQQTSMTVADNGGFDLSVGDSYYQEIHGGNH